jgi:hypothetical protein
MASSTIIQLFVLYGLLVIAVVSSLTIIILRLPRVGQDRAATQAQLTAILERLDDVDQRFDRVDNNIGELDNRFEILPSGMNEDTRRQTDLVMQALTHHNHGDGTDPSFTVPLEGEAAESENPLTDRPDSQRQEDGP